MTNPEHLNDGAYVSLTQSGEVVVTANHHDPSLASDRVFLTDFAIERLVKWLDKNDKLDRSWLAK